MVFWYKPTPDTVRLSFDATAPASIPGLEWAKNKKKTQKKKKKKKKLKCHLTKTMYVFMFQQRSLKDVCK